MTTHTLLLTNMTFDKKKKSKENKEEDVEVYLESLDKATDVICKNVEETIESLKKKSEAAIESEKNKTFSWVV